MSVEGFLLKRRRFRTPHAMYQLTCDEEHFDLDVAVGLKEECKYFLYECLGDVEPCFEFLPKTSSKLKKVEIEIDNETSL